MTSTARTSAPMHVKLARRSVLNPETGCTEWAGAVSNRGDGYIRTVVNGARTNHPTHRLAYELAYGPIPDGMAVGHTCGRHLCVTPEHLILRSRSEIQALRLAKHGPSRPATPVADRLARRTVANPATGCHEWMGSVDRGGYGQIGLGSGGVGKTHRVAYETAHGPIPARMHVLHQCDNRRCVRVDHLFLGTNNDNVADRHAKGRTLKGSETASAKLNETSVKAILALSTDGRFTQQALADLFGVSGSCINLVVSRKTWKHVNAPVAVAAARGASGSHMGARAKADRNTANRQVVPVR